MKTEVSIEQLLRWRLALAEAEAPPALRAARLLELARPWWEQYPERFQCLLQSLMSVEVGVGQRVAGTPLLCTQHPVPTLIVRANEQFGTSVQVLYLSVSESQLHFRFAVDGEGNLLEEDFEVTFVSNSPAKPLFLAEARRLVEIEYRLDAGIPPQLTEQWASLKVTDPMPFRLILHSTVTET
jgi:hypothetical protein